MYGVIMDICNGDLYKHIESEGVCCRKSGFIGLDVRSLINCVRKDRRIHTFAIIAYTTSPSLTTASE